MRPAHLWVVFVAVLGVAHLLLRTAAYGAAVNADSVTYLSAAISFLNGDGLQHSRGCPLVGQPPLYSLLIAFGTLLGSEPLEAARLINAASLGLIILVCGLWMCRNIGSPVVLVCAAFAVMAAHPLNHYAAVIRTEPVFILCVLLALMCLGRFLQRQGDWTPLILAAGCSALAALTRYPGVVLMLVGAVLILLRREVPFAANLKRAVVFGAASSIPLAVLLGRNLAVSGTLVGNQSRPFSSTLSESLAALPEVLRDWLLPLSAPAWVGALLWLAVALLLLGVAAIVILSRWPNPAQGEQTWASILPFAAFIPVYAAFMAVATPLTVSQTLDGRYLLPIYPPLLLAGAFLLDRFLSVQTLGRLAALRRALIPLIALAVLANISLSARRSFLETAKAMETGHYAATYNTAYWKDSETLKYLRARRLQGVVRSNNPYMLWFADAGAPMGKYRTLPFRLPRLIALLEEGPLRKRCVVPGTLPDLRQRIEQADGAMTILWLKRFQRDEYGFDDEDLRLLPGVQTVADLKDGILFRATLGRPLGGPTASQGGNIGRNELRERETETP